MKKIILIAICLLSSFFTFSQDIITKKNGEDLKVKITEVNQTYLDMGQLNVSILPNGTAWMDTGTFSSLLDAGNYVRTLQDRQGNKISCLEEIAYKQKWITSEKLEEIIHSYKNTEYGNYLKNVLEDLR